jgi:hypothetical protein
MSYREENGQVVLVKVRDISFDEVERQHRLPLNEEYWELWERLRGKSVAVRVPCLGEEENCIIGGRVFLTVDTFCRSLCEHQIEVGD